MVSSDDRGVPLFRLLPGMTIRENHPVVTRSAGASTASHEPDAQEDQAEREPPGGKQGGKGSGHYPKEKRHPQQSQQRGTRGTTHRSGQPRRQQREQPRPAP